MAAPSFGAPRWGKTKYGGDCFLHELSSNPGFMYVFTIKKRSLSKTQWKCSGCFSIKPRSQPVPLVTVESNQLLHDPENPSNAHFCQPIPYDKVEARQIYTQVRETVKQSGKRPRAAYQEALATVTRTFAGDAAARNAVQVEMPEFKKVRTSLYRAYNEKYPIVSGISGIPPALTMTLEGSYSTDINDPKYQESNIIYQEANPPLLVFACEQDLRVLSTSPHWVADGTFQYRPLDVKFGQLYVIFGFINSEAVACVHALLPDKALSSYQILFKAVHNSLVQKFGSVGALSHGHFDFEEAAIIAFQRVFTLASVKGCVFHYSQSLNRNIGSKGLKSVYDQSIPQGHNAPQFQPVRVWVRRIVALTLLPSSLVLAYWCRVLKSPPITGSTTVDANLQVFASYVEAQWLRDQSRVDLLNHWDRDGPRTNNNAEGHNNGLRSKFQRVHPRLAVFLVEFQEFHHDIQVRSRQLLNGSSPHPRLQRYIDNDNHIAHAKQVFQGILSALNPTSPSYGTDVDREISVYLDQVQHYLG